MIDKSELIWADEGADDIVQYDFIFPDNRVFVFKVSPTREIKFLDSPELPDWTLLDHHKCPGCTLDSATINRCPAAVDLSEMLILFDEVKSFEQIKIKVTTAQRVVLRDCDVQTGLQSFIGLVMASSGCPVLAKFKPMAVNHLPFSSAEETLYRTCANYLLEQFFKKRNGQKPDWEFKGLTEFYYELQSLNTNFAKRFSRIVKKDANINAIIRLFSISALVHVALDEGLNALEEIYDFVKNEK